MHPLLAELFKILPPPGAAWSVTERVAWLRCAEGCFRILYRSDISSEIEIEPADSATAPVESPEEHRR